MNSRIILFLLLQLVACQPATPTPPLPTLASIRVLNFWEPVTGTLSSMAEVHEWRFIAQANDEISLRTLSDNVTLSLQTDNALTLARGNRLEVHIPRHGTYIVLVQLTQEGATTYELGLGYTDKPRPAAHTPTLLPEIVGVPTPTPISASLGMFMGSLVSGQTIGATFDDTGNRHVYIFEGAEAQYVTIQMGHVNGTVDPIITLYDSEGAAMATDDNSGGDQTAVIRNIELPRDGVYSIGAEGDGFPGSYWISLSIGEIQLPVTPTIRAPSPTPFVETLTPVLSTAIPGNPLEDHVPLIEHISREGESDSFPIYATAGDVLTIAVSPLDLSQIQSYIEIYGPTGELLASASSQDGIAGRDALVPMLPITSTGMYRVLVRGIDNESTGDYYISYGIGPSHENTLRGLTQPNLIYSGEIIRRGLRDVWSLYLNEGDIVTVSISPSSDMLDPFLELIGPDGLVVAMDDNSGGERTPLISSATASVTGLYRLRITPVDAATSGSYTLTWRYLNIGPTPTAVPALIPIMIFDDFVPDNTYLFYPFQGQAGQRVLIGVQAEIGSSLDPVVALLAPDGSLMAEHDDGETSLNPSFFADLPTDGIYTVRVNGYRSSGPFQMRVDLVVEG